MMKIFTLTALLAVAANAAQWDLQQPGIGTVFISLDFADSQTGWSAGLVNGYGNVIYRFNDGGDSYENTLDDPLMSFGLLGTSGASNSSAFACGIGLAVLSPAVITSDGQTWAPVGNSVRGVCQSAGRSPNCYFMTGAFLEGLQEIDFAMTCDGGETIKGALTGSDLPTRYGSFVNDTYGFLSCGVFPTSSASRLHIEGNRGDSIFHISDSITTNAPSHAQRYRHEADDYAGSILRTYDGGATWEEVFRTDGRYYFNGIQFVNSNVGFVVAENNRDGIGAILKTDDGGETWREVFTTSHSLLTIFMGSEKEGWAGGAEFALGVQTYLLHTVDGGETWERFDNELRHYIGEISGSDPENVWAIGFTQVTSSLMRYYP